MSHVASKRNLFSLYFSTKSDKALVLGRAVLSIFLGLICLSAWIYSHRLVWLGRHGVDFLFTDSFV